MAGLYEHPDGRKEIVIAGGAGKKSTEIFDLTFNEWRRGPGQ